MLLLNWLTKWQVPAAALDELLDITGLLAHDVATLPGRSEGAVSNIVRIAASRAGWRLFRNNVGALKNESGRLVRYGLLNDSKGLNEFMKSGDLIGLKPILIGPQHVGHVIGQFVSREVKHEGWEPGEDAAREEPQTRWAMLINSLGGDAKFTTGEL